MKIDVIIPRRPLQPEKAPTGSCEGKAYQEAVKKFGLPKNQLTESVSRFGKDRFKGI